MENAATVTRSVCKFDCFDVQTEYLMNQVGFVTLKLFQHDSRGKFVRFRSLEVA